MTSWLERNGSFLFGCVLISLGVWLAYPTVGVPESGGSRIAFDGHPIFVLVSDPAADLSVSVSARPVHSGLLRVTSFPGEGQKDGVRIALLNPYGPGQEVMFSPIEVASCEGCTLLEGSHGGRAWQLLEIPLDGQPTLDFRTELRFVRGARVDFVMPAFWSAPVDLAKDAEEVFSSATRTRWYAPSAEESMTIQTSFSDSPGATLERTSGDTEKSGAHSWSGDGREPLFVRILVDEWKSAMDLRLLVAGVIFGIGGSVIASVLTAGSQRSEAPTRGPSATQLEDPALRVERTSPWSAVVALGLLTWSLLDRRRRRR